MRAATVGLFTLACFYTLYFASDILIPLAIAVLLAMTLAPLVHLLERVKVPRLLGAGLVVFGALGLTVTGIHLILQPAVAWIAEAPAKLAELEPRIEQLRAPLERIRSASENISEVAENGEADGEADDAVQVRVKGPGILESALAESPQMIASIVAIVFLMYFLLAYGDHVMHKISLLGERYFGDGGIKDVAKQIQHQVTHFLVVFAMINAGLAIIVSAALATLGFPNPILWGVVAGVLNFAPYVGATITAVLLTGVGLLNLESLALALIIPLGFLTLTSLEGQLVTPTVLGHQLALSPYVVFLSIILWGWLWGMPGALMAVPLLVITKILADNLPGLDWLSIMLRRTDSDRLQDLEADSAAAP